MGKCALSLYYKAYLQIVSVSVMGLNVVVMDCSRLDVDSATRLSKSHSLGAASTQCGQVHLELNLNTKLIYNRTIHLG